MLNGQRFPHPQFQKTRIGYDPEGVTITRPGLLPGAVKLRFDVGLQPEMGGCMAVDVVQNLSPNQLNTDRHDCLYYSSISFHETLKS